MAEKTINEIIEEILSSNDRVENLDKYLEGLTPQKKKELYDKYFINYGKEDAKKLVEKILGNVPKVKSSDSESKIVERNVSEALRFFNPMFGGWGSGARGAIDQNLKNIPRFYAEEITEISRLAEDTSDGEYNGYFLNHLLHKCFENNVDIDTSRWYKPPVWLGKNLNGKYITVNGSVGDYALYYAESCILSADIIINNAGHYAKQCMISAKSFGDYTGSNSKDNNFQGETFGENTGHEAVSSTFEARVGIKSISENVGRGCEFYIGDKLIKSTKFPNPSWWKRL